MYSEWVKGNTLLVSWLLLLERENIFYYLHCIFACYYIHYSTETCACLNKTNNITKKTAFQDSQQVKHLTKQLSTVFAQTLLFCSPHIWSDKYKKADNCYYCISMMIGYFQMIYPYTNSLSTNNSKISEAKLLTQVCCFCNSNNF